MKNSIEQPLINDCHNYDKRRSYNNRPLRPGECLVPIHVTQELLTHSDICRDNLETWHFPPGNVLVAFAPVAIEKKATFIKFFNQCVREFFSSLHDCDTLSFDQFMDDLMLDENIGFEPASSENLEETVIQRISIHELPEQLSGTNPKYGLILKLLCKGYTKKRIIDTLGLSKSQGYATIKAAQMLAKKLYLAE